MQAMAAVKGFKLRVGSGGRGSVGKEGGGQGGGAGGEGIPEVVVCVERVMSSW